MNPWLDALFEKFLFLSCGIHLLFQCPCLLHLCGSLSEDDCLCSYPYIVILLLKLASLYFQALYVGVLLHECEDAKGLVQHTSTVLHYLYNFFQPYLDSANVLLSNFWGSGRLHLQQQLRNLEI